MRNKAAAIVLGAALALGSGIRGGSAADSHAAMPIAGHDHAASGGAKDPASEAYVAAMRRMHDAMPMRQTGDPDVDFVRGMIPHHDGAVAMAEVELRYGKDPELKRLAQEVVDAQRKEIGLMQGWLKKHGH